MNKRSTYTFQINCAQNVINSLLQSYINGNKFILQNKDGEQFYRAGDAMLEGYRYFNYSITEGILTIQAWFKGPFGEIPIEQNNLNILAMDYRNSLGKLFQEIEKLNNGGINMNDNNEMNSNLNTEKKSNQDYQQNSVQSLQQSNQFSQKFQDETTKKQEKMCEWGFWISIFGLFASFFGVSYGVIIYILDFYFASQGLKTCKRNKAIATIIISILSIVIIILQIEAV